MSAYNEYLWKTGREWWYVRVTRQFKRVVSTCNLLTHGGDATNSLVVAQRDSMKIWSLFLLVCRCPWWQHGLYRAYHLSVTIMERHMWFTIAVFDVFSISNPTGGNVTLIAMITTIVSLWLPYQISLEGPPARYAALCHASHNSNRI